MVNHKTVGRARAPALALVLAVVGALSLAARPAAAQTNVTFNLSQLSSDSTLPSALSATVTFHMNASNQLTQVDVNNTSLYSITGLWFNAAGISGLAFIPPVDSAWSISGSGASQALAADGMGSFNWAISFGTQPGDRLESGLTSFGMSHSGSLTSASALNVLGAPPPPQADQRAFVVAKFQAGPGGDSAFGGTNTPGTITTTVTGFVIPEGPGLSLMAFGLLPVAGLALMARRRRRVSSD